MLIKNVKKENEDRKALYQAEMVALEFEVDPTSRAAFLHAETTFNTVKQKALSSDYLNNNLDCSEAINKMHEDGRRIESVHHLFPRECLRFKNSINPCVSTLNDFLVARSTRREAFNNFSSTVAWASVKESNSLISVEIAGTALLNASSTTLYKRDLWSNACIENENAAFAFNEASFKAGDPFYASNPGYRDCFNATTAVRVAITSEKNTATTTYNEFKNALNSSIYAYREAAKVIASKQALKEQKFQELRRQFQSLHHNIEHLQQKIWETQDAIMNQEALFFTENQRLNNEEAFHNFHIQSEREKIKIIENNILQLQNIQQELMFNQATIDEEASLCQLELEVNSDLFSKIRKIIRVLNLNGEVIDRFMSLNNP